MLKKNTGNMKGLRRVGPYCMNLGTRQTLDVRNAFPGSAEATEKTKSGDRSQ